MRKKISPAPKKAVSREQLNQLMDAMALLIARRQMRHYWAPVNPASLSA
jgi:hypothetical protein